ncbi:hypothetical protein [Brevibacillus parabrevis]|uniref:hypothetical protein n=1 Tax=Brevibacillus parabrevis TaxID=54914 RepID=UPI0028D699DD|nr:hypothetical protein [Brevibacillus parabrevis]
MKKIMTRPVLAVVTAAGLIGCLTPLLADASSTGAAETSKVVMNEQGQKATRYQLKELVQSDPATLNTLLKTQADHLYIIVDKINLNVKLQSYMETNKAEWERIYRDYYSDIWLEVRSPKADEQLVSVSAQTKSDKVYIKGLVTPDVTKVVVTKPNGDIIETVPTSEHSFTVSFPAVGTSAEQYVTVQAFAGSVLADTEKVKLVAQTEEDKNRLLHMFTVYDAKKAEWQVKGIVKHGAERVVVTYNGVRKEASLKKLLDNVDSFSVAFENPTADANSSKAVIEVYEAGKKVDEDSIAIEPKKTPGNNPAADYSIAGTAVHDIKKKQIELKGTVKGWDKKQEAKLFAIKPDGKKKEIKPNDKGEYALELTYKDRSYTAKAIQLELYVKDKLVKQADIVLSTKVIVAPPKHEEDEKKHKHPNGKAYGFWKKHDGKWDDDDRDDDDRDRDKDDDDRDKKKDK